VKLKVAVVTGAGLLISSVQAAYVVDLGVYPIRDYSYVYPLSMSDDGRTVAGWAHSDTAGRPNQGWIWTEMGHMKLLTTPPGITQIPALAVSGDGRLYAGASVGPQSRAAIIGPVTNPNAFATIPQ
jgi:hypothetical protein